MSALSNKDKIAAQQQEISRLKLWIKNQGEPALKRSQSFQIENHSLQRYLSSDREELNALQAELATVKTENQKISETLKRSQSSLHVPTKSKKVVTYATLKQRNNILMNQGSKLLDKLTKSENENTSLQRELTESRQLIADKAQCEARADELAVSLRRCKADLVARDDHIEKLNRRLASIRVEKEEEEHKLNIAIPMDDASESRTVNESTLELWSCDNEHIASSSPSERRSQRHLPAQDDGSAQHEEPTGAETVRLMKIIREYEDREEKLMAEVSRLHVELSDMKIVQRMSIMPWDSTPSSCEREEEKVESVDSDSEQHQGTAESNTSSAQRRRMPRQLDVNTDLYCTDLRWRFKKFRGSLWLFSSP